MNQLLINSALRLLMGGLSFYLAQKGFDSASVDTIQQAIVSLLGASGVAGVALAWSAKDKQTLRKPLTVEGYAELPTPVLERDPIAPEFQTVNKGFSLGERSRKNLEGVHPDLVQIIEYAIVGAPYDFTVIEGVRNETRQRAMLNKGKSLTMNSKHLLQKDGYGHAVDLGYIHDGILDDRFNIYEELNNHISNVAVQLGLSVKWGGYFKRSNGKPFVDAGHWQLD